MTPPSFRVPPPLNPGDRVAVIAPSSGLAADFPDVFTLGLERLEEVFDLEPVVFPSARQGPEFLQTHPRARAADIHTAFRDPSISGVIATIGGHDQLRVLKYLDAATLRENPTRFYGMSDNTNLGLFLWRAGIVSYNGGQLMNDLAVPGTLPSYTERMVSNAFFEDPGTLQPSTVWTDASTDWWHDDSLPTTPPSYTPHPGWKWAGGTDRVTGPIWGGSRVAVDNHLASERFLPHPRRLDDAILALEIATTLPNPDTVATSLMSMGERGLLDRFQAVIVGLIPGQNRHRSPPPDNRNQYRSAVRAAIHREVSRYNPDAPIVFGLNWGHTTPVSPLPLGATLTVDPQRETLQCASPARTK
jgi:muramoyltetrapeptide carboxypeptidase LdcA involved in peptidoglycan recycling